MFIPRPLDARGLGGGFSRLVADAEESARFLPPRLLSVPR